MQFRIKRILFVFVFITIFNTGCRLSVGQSPVRIDGAYRLVSETTILEKPRKPTTYRKPPDWVGLFLFTDGFFAVSLVDNGRSGDWFTKFPKNIGEVGYETSSGKYEIKGTTLTLEPRMGLHPFFDSRISVFEIKIEGDNLVLTQTFAPYVEDMRKGKRVLVLSRTNTSDAASL